jgi:hypothetical protein
LTADFAKKKDAWAERYSQLDREYAKLDTEHKTLQGAYKLAKQQLTNMEIEMEQIEHQARISECTVNQLEAAKSDMMEKLTLMEMDTEILQERENGELDDLRSKLRDSEIEVEDLREKNSVFTRLQVAKVGVTNAGGAFSKKKDGLSICSLDFSVTSANKENVMGVWVNGQQKVIKGGSVCGERKRPTLKNNLKDIGERVVLGERKPQNQKNAKKADQGSIGSGSQSEGSRHHKYKQSNGKRSRGRETESLEGFEFAAAKMQSQGHGQDGKSVNSDCLGNFVRGKLVGDQNPENLGTIQKKMISIVSGAVKRVNSGANGANAQNPNKANSHAGRTQGKWVAKPKQKVSSGSSMTGTSDEKSSGLKPANGSIKSGGPGPKPKFSIKE